MPLTEALIIPVPFATPGAGIGTGNVAQQRQQQGKGVVGDRSGIGPGAVGDGDAAGGSGGQVDLLVASADHADDLQVGQCVDFGCSQAQWATGEHGVDFLGMAQNGICPLLRRGGTDQAVAGLLQYGQVIIDGFHQYQDCLVHATSFFEGALCGISSQYSQSK
ncbi:hypothetical protein QIY50_02770 [Pseudomonas putida]|nr:hypothetical protein QIY50_02770 [Pseudomonas putida]